MTNKNKNTKRLVKTADQTSPTPLEMIPTLTDTDDVRIKLQDRIESARDATAIRQALESNLIIANQMITELTAKLTSEQAANRKLQETNETLRADFERETRLIQFELGTAQQTIADQDVTNQELASDLIDNQGYRQALETHLGDVEKKNTRKIRQLESKLADAKAKSHKQEHKLRARDSTIANLMQELANQSSKLIVTGELDSAFQKVDRHRPQKSAAPRKGERVTRQLIGSADGQELRFPLFRKRLSIGRTRLNDIQLDLRFVSRRHAVIATDDNVTRIIDLGSRNGVYVNKKRITEKFLRSGDVITIGLTHLRYEERAKR